MTYKVTRISIKFLMIFAVFTAQPSIPGPTHLWLRVMVALHDANTTTLQAVPRGSLMGNIR